MANLQLAPVPPTLLETPLWKNPWLQALVVLSGIFMISLGSRRVAGVYELGRGTFVGRWGQE